MIEPFHVFAKVLANILLKVIPRKRYSGQNTVVVHFFMFYIHYIW